MVTLHSVFVFCAVASIASAGPCKPGSSISLSLSETSSAASTTETTLLESTTTAPSTTLAESTSTDITVETSLTETSTEAASETTSAAIVESSTTTFVTSIADTTTTEAATTTTSAAPRCIPDQCVGTIKIQCDVVIYGLVDYVSADDTQACADLCNADDNCEAFTFDYKFNLCYKTGSIEQRVIGPYNGYDTGIKGTCQV
ncbi:uncharacterized protein FTJAE_1511 [Fusarium tjaetaba]|uniref:Apple domain-containing protein n=1 Tax=Fusarium tjaetaba TaxID=1567544 RepID=A0A8H5SB56_9HYPO|nr:uncharacterized protein FTJAE_1511 [Fusarium tjaetaba]KAF5647828.1 hypothetical protein FTJAE_1511 [Fusarium tjaetaba]